MSAQDVYELLVQRLADESGLGVDVRRPYESAWAAELDERLILEDAGFRVRFSRTPPAGTVSDALALLDRESRRVVRGLEEGEDPGIFRGRGVHLRPRAQGLHVAEAHPGSLDLILILGGLYAAISSQPVSFALNVMSIVSYGRGFIGLLTRDRRRRSQRVTVRGPGWEIEGPENTTMIFDAQDADGNRLRFAYFPDGRPPAELPQGFFDD